MTGNQQCSQFQIIDVQKAACWRSQLYRHSNRSAVWCESEYHCYGNDWSVNELVSGPEFYKVGFRRHAPMPVVQR